MFQENYDSFVAEVMRRKARQVVFYALAKCQLLYIIPITAIGLCHLLRAAGSPSATVEEFLRSNGTLIDTVGTENEEGYFARIYRINKAGSAPP